MPDCPGTDGGVRPGGQKYCREGDGCHFVHCLEEGLFRFEEVRLEDIMETLSRWYDVDVFFDDDALRHTLFTGDLKRYDNIGVHLRMLEMTTNVAFEVKGNAVFVGYRK